MTESATNGTMICLNWTLVILAASVQVSLMIFYSIGLAYNDSSFFANYTTVMMYVNILCTCSSQIILAFIFSMMSEPIEVVQAQSKLNSGGQFVWEVRRDSLPVFRQECERPIGAGLKDNDLSEPLQIGNINKVAFDETSYNSDSTYNVERNFTEARIKSGEVRRLMQIFFAFCEPLGQRYQ